ncbi:uncharacterized protein N7479_010247 [Penicillium vulpinum]|nr:uncharacterized protein N7479_010247 [Penicillium vulpinum]KAJ5951834.1 hypothetical protein N7479_010247 [Penicillium vulpinum]
MPSDNPACADCKAKKKRCMHRNQPVKVAEAEVTSANMSDPCAATPAPTPSLTPAATPVPATVPGAATRGRRKAAEAAEAKPKEMSPAPADSSDELSSVPSEAEQKPVVKSTKRSRRAKTSAAAASTTTAKAQDEVPDLPAESQSEVPDDLPADLVNAACTMSVHSIWARKLQANLQELEANMQAANEAHRVTMATAQEIQRTVDGWIQTWTATGR